jgi:polar amino acid transport system substrate-binding protein
VKARFVVALLCLLVLPAGCGGSSGAPDDPGAAAYPTEDVLSGITADPALFGRLPSTARTDHSLVLGTSVTPGNAGLPHDGVAPDGTYIGLDVDLRNAVARKLGITWQVHADSFTAIVPGVQNGRYDVGEDNFGVTAAREQVVDYATYLTDGQAFLASTRIGLRGVTAITDLCGLTIATSPGSIFATILARDASQCAAAGRKPFTVQLFADTAPIWLGLGNGRVDVFFGPTLSMRYDATHVPGVRFLGQIGSTPVGMVTARGSGLAPVISNAVNELIAEGVYAAILRKWDVNGSAIARSEVDPAPTL